MTHIGKLESLIVSARSPVIARFADGQIVEFETLAEGRGFLEFYHRSPSARKQNPARIYSLQDGTWIEDKNGQKVKAAPQNPASVRSRKRQ